MTMQITLLDLAGKVARVGEREAARQFGGGHASWQLQQRQRVATRLRDDPVADVGVESARDDSRQQSTRILLGESSQLQLRQAHERVFVGLFRERRARSSPTPPAAV